MPGGEDLPRRGRLEDPLGRRVAGSRPVSPHPEQVHSGSGQAAALIMISSHAEDDYADLIAGSPTAGFLAKADLSAAAIRHVLGMG